MKSVDPCKIPSLKPVPNFTEEDFEGTRDLKEPGDTQSDILKEKFQKSILNQEQDYPLPTPVISIKQGLDYLSFLTLKSFSLWQGKQKSKKTTSLALAVAAFLKGLYNDLGCFKAECEGVVLFVDTEQGESYAARTMKLILKLAGVEKSDKLIYLDLREYSPKERREIIQYAIENTPDIRLTVIDGIVDLMDDFMDSAEGHLTITELLKYCSKYNIHIAGVLHQNKNDKNARAHVGSISSQKCEVEIATEVDTNDRAQSIVSCVNSRGIPFEPFAIRWEKGSLPVVVEDWKDTNSIESKANKAYSKGKEIAEAVFQPLMAYSHTESINGIMEYTHKSESTAKRLIKDLKVWKFINKGSDEKYRINIQ